MRLRKCLGVLALVLAGLSACATDSAHDRDSGPASVSSDPATSSPSELPSRETVEVGVDGGSSSCPSRTISAKPGESIICVEVGTVGDDIAFDYEAACPDVNKAAGQCPLDDRGRALWKEVVAAFEHTLTPSQLSGAPVAAGTTEYTFMAQIGTDQDEPPSASSDNNKGRRNQLWVRATVGSDAEPGQANIVVHPSDTEDFIFGEGTVTVTREDGIEMIIEFWGAPSAQATQHGAPDIISLFKRATTRLAFE